MVESRYGGDVMYRWPNDPLPGAQQGFVESDKLEARFYGGRRGGKTEALLMAAVRDINIPDYTALILAPEYARLSFVLERVIGWAEQYEGVKWDYTDQALLFPNGSSLLFGRESLPYAGRVLDFVGVDDLGELDEGMYDGSLIIRLRGESGAAKRYRTTHYMPMSGSEMWESQ